MQFIDLAAQQKRIRTQIENNIKKVLDHGKYIMGPEIRELEEKLASYAGVEYAVGVASGTDALLMALMAYEIGAGDAVLTTTFTFIATGEVIRLIGATPVFVDIDPGTYNINPVEIEKTIKKITSGNKLKPRCIIPVDLFGQPADYDEINSLAKKYNLFVIDDAAQGFGASYKGKKVGSLAPVTATSFFPAKPLGAYGDGGMIFTGDANIYDKLLSIRVHGQGSDKYNNIRVGINGRLDSLQAAVLLAKMEIFEEEIEMRQEAARRYSEALKDVVKVPYVKSHNISSWAQYSVLHPQRDRVIEKLNKKGIPAAIYYPIPLHLQEAFSFLGYRKGDFPVSEEIAAQIFSIPMHPYLSAADQDRIVEAIKSSS